MDGDESFRNSEKEGDVGVDESNAKSLGVEPSGAFYEACKLFCVDLIKSDCSARRAVKPVLFFTSSIARRGHLNWQFFGTKLSEFFISSYFLFL